MAKIKHKYNKVLKKELEKIFSNFNKNLIKPVKYCSLCSSVGIGEFYWEQIGLISTVANDLLENRLENYKKIHPSVGNIIPGDISEPDIYNKLVAAYKSSGCEALCCCCPCQSYSTAAGLTASEKAADKRTYLFEVVLKFIRETKPKWIFMENVKQMLTCKVRGKTIKQILIKALKKMGYYVKVEVLNANDYGAPQARERAYILASLDSDWVMPTPHDYKPTIGDVIDELPSVEAGETSGIVWHDGPYLHPTHVDIIRHTPSGCSAHDNPSPWKPCKVSGAPTKAKFHSGFSRKNKDKPCNTILQDSKSVAGMITMHYGRPMGLDAAGYPIFSDARGLTILELFRCTTLPDNFIKPGEMSDAAIRQAMGEAVIPLVSLQLMIGMLYHKI